MNVEGIKGIKGKEELGKKEESRKGRRVKGIVLVMVMMMVVMGCNSGGVGESKESVENRFLKSLVGLSNEFLNVFTSFGEMVGSVLGLNVNSKKSDVGNYFKKVQGTVEGIKTGLNKIVADMKEEKNPNAEATATAVKTLVESKLDKIIEGAKTASEAIGDASGLLGDMANAAVGGTVGEVDKLINGIKGIVDVVLKEGNPVAGTEKKALDGQTDRTGGNAADDEAGKLFNGTNAGAADTNAKKSAADAAKAVGAVTGADILQAMIKVGGGAYKLANAKDDDKPSTKKDAIIAGAIALRAMAKGGKFAGQANAEDAIVVVKDTAISAVTKALDILTVAIRRSIDIGLKSVKEAMKINTNATTVALENSGSGGQNK
ncbi:variable large family protein [Borrelia crocidurae]|uniref:Variable large protein n=1 Tax=Borrelia crocidurae (strain Achema) TaxID=1155096 RepID=I0FEJ1_BORCA|nr:variable large family protein [Borrelia crocidurae]AFI31897.1 Vlp protein, gamma subfamily [Borrelia crocidurae str. Achema]